MAPSETTIPQPSTTGTGSGTPVRTFRVLHVLDHSWPLLSGYSIRSRNIVQSQQYLGHMPKVVTGPLHQIDDKQAQEAVEKGIQYFRSPLGPISQPLLSKRVPVLREAAVVRLLRNRILELLEEEEFDVVHAHSPALCGLAAAQATRVKNVPFVYEVRAFWEDAAVDQQRTMRNSLRYRAGRWLEDRVVTQADAVVGIATSIIAEFKQRGVNPQKLFHVSNGVDADRFSPQPRDRDTARALGVENDVVLGFIGSLYRYEGVAWLVPALAELRRRGARFKAIVIGDGEATQDIRQAIQDAQAEDYIFMPGRVPHDQVLRYYSVMDIMVYPRRSVRLTELVTPLKPLEAMALGKAVVGSSVGGIKELVHQDENGILFAPDDVDEFCRKVAPLISDENYRRDLGSRARDYVLQHNHWNIIARRYEAVYDYATRNHRA